MNGLKSTLANLARLRGRFEGLLAGAAKAKGPEAEFSARHLREVTGFGSNPGNLRMLTHMRRNLPESPALVVALHGCTQTAADYDRGSGWSELAYRHGFAVLFPEQKRANNPNNCFNWFLPSDTGRGAGEALSIRQMIDQMVEEQGIDRSRVFIVGLSAGGAMAAAMLAAYPEAFAGGAVIAGLPYGGGSTFKKRCRRWRSRGSALVSNGGIWFDPRLRIPDHGRRSRCGMAAPTPSSILRIWKKPSNSGSMFMASPLRPQAQEELHGHLRRAWRTNAGDDVIEAVTIQDEPRRSPRIRTREHWTGRRVSFRRWHFIKPAYRALLGHR